MRKIWNWKFRFRKKKSGSDTYTKIGLWFQFPIPIPKPGFGCTLLPRILKCYTVTLHFKKEGMYNKYLKIQHLFWQVNKQENNHPFSPFFLQKWLPFEKGCEPFNLWDVPVSFCTINVTFSSKTNFANGFATLKILRLRKHYFIKLLHSPIICKDLSLSNRTFLSSHIKTQKLLYLKTFTLTSHKLYQTKEI